MYIFAAFIVGILLGVGVAVIIFLRFRAGVLRVDLSDPHDRPYLFLELDLDIIKLIKKRYALLKVETRPCLPHK